MYTCISPELEAKLKMENPEALVDLKSMCDRGKVLGNSKGRKGFIIKGKSFLSDDNVKQTKAKKKQKTTKLYLKGKHCKRNWRFFGESTTKIINNKTYHLFTINAWNPKHNGKTISF